MSETQQEYRPGDIVLLRGEASLIDADFDAPWTPEPPVGSVATVVRLSDEEIDVYRDVVYLSFWCRPEVLWVAWVHSVTLVAPVQINGDNSDV